MNLLWLSHPVPWPPSGVVLQRSHDLVTPATWYAAALARFSRRSRAA